MKIPPQAAIPVEFARAARAVIGAKMKKKRRILVVDDEKHNVEVLSRCLSANGYDISTAANGEEAVARLYADEPDLVLMDVTMPVMDGLAACRKIRSDFTRRSLPIVMVTAGTSFEDRLAALRAGVDDFIGKPFDLEEVKLRVETVLERRTWDLSIQPLTHLPGSPAIEEQVWHRLRAGISFAFAYIDIDNFKSYNDVYGYEAGDRVIKCLAERLVHATRGTDTAFAGHVGGDDFAFLANITDMPRLLEEASRAFDDQRVTFYSREHFDRGSIMTKDRRGENQTFPLITLSAAVISTATRRILHYARLIEIASELKAFVKRQPHDGRSLTVWDRRRDLEAGLAVPPDATQNAPRTGNRTGSVELPKKAA